MKNNSIQHTFRNLLLNTVTVLSILFVMTFILVDKARPAEFPVGKHTISTIDPRMTVNLVVLAASNSQAGYVHAKWTYTRDDYPVNNCPVDFHGVLPDFSSEEFRKFSMQRCSPANDSGGDQGANGVESSGCE